MALGVLRSWDHLPLARGWVKPMAGKGEVARESLKVLLRDGSSAFRVIVLEHRLHRNMGRENKAKS